MTEPTYTEAQIRAAFKVIVDEDFLVGMARYVGPERLLAALRAEPRDTPPATHANSCCQLPRHAPGDPICRPAAASGEPATHEFVPAMPGSGLGCEHSYPNGAWCGRASSAPIHTPSAEETPDAR